MSAAPTTPMTQASSDPERISQRIEELLDRLAEQPDPTVRAHAEELVRVLMDFYGDGLARIVQLAGQPAAANGPLRTLLSDDLVAGLLVLHDLHPHDTLTRITTALDELPGNTCEFASYDAESGTLWLRPAESSGCGCPSTQAATTQRVTAALACVAPEVTSVQLELAEKAAEPVLVQIGVRPPGAAS